MKPSLEQLEKDASDDAARIGALLGWLNSHQMSVAATGDWHSLRKFCREDLTNALRFYIGQRDTQDLYRVLVHLEKAQPTDRAARNNLAQVSLLLNLDADRAYRLAREVYEQEPKNLE